MSDFAKGKTHDVVVSSEGTLSLGPASKLLAEKLPDAWTINAIVADQKGTVYLGTSPNGAIFKYADGKLTKIYSADTNEPNTPKDPNAAPTQQYLANQHIFAMAIDGGGRLLAGVSGNKATLLRFDNNGCQKLFEPNDTKYIFAIALDEVGTIYLGTGPKGKIYRLNPFGSKPEVIYTGTDKNFLSLAIGNGNVYAGSDERGLVYRIDPVTKSAVVLYDAEQSDITGLVLDGSGDLYAAATVATPAKTVLPQTENLPGKPEVKVEVAKKPSEGAVQLQVANTAQKPTEEEQAKSKAMLTRPTLPPGQASHIYKITRDGFVTDVFQEAAAFFALTAQNNNLLVAVGGKARLFSINPQTQRKEVIYQDEQASQITAVIVAGEETYLGTANPAKLIRLAASLAKEGDYTSALIDAGQPAKWGKFQLEADVPAGTKVKVSARSGNVNDANDPTYSPWTSPQAVKEPLQLDIPQGRFCQYKLIFSDGGKTTPTVREVAVPYVVPNLPPQVDAVSIARVDTPDKPGIFKITYKAVDRNNDKLVYRIDIRQVGRANWIKVKEDLEADIFDWDSKTVEDGRYEIKITASDKRSNTTVTALEDSRVSDPVIVDNTPPAIKSPEVTVKGTTATLKFTAVDTLSAIGSVSYTVDSSAEWNGTLPDDLVYDTTGEDFTITVNKLEPGQHVIAVKVTDAVGNTVYKTFEIDIK